MRILFLSPWFPFPPDNGSKIRIYHLLRALAQKHEVSLIAFTDNPGPIDGAGLTGVCRLAGVVPKPVFHPGSARAVAGLFRPEPRHVLDTFSPQMAQLVAGRLAASPFDAVIASQSAMAPYLCNHAACPALFEEVELSIIREHYLRTPAGPARLRRRLTWQKTQHYTARLVRRFAACTVVSEQERANLRAILPGYENISVIPNGVDTELMQPNGVQAQPATLIYNGALTWGANYDAMAYFLRSIWPLIRARQPDARLSITGSTSGVDLSGLALDDHVTLTGHLPDIAAAVRSAWACIVPLRIGGGTRLKILEAMAVGTPVIATAKGAEGLYVAHDENILLADDPGQFAAQTLRLLNDPQLRQRLAAQARRLVEEKYSWSMIGKQFVELVERMAGGAQEQ